MRSVDSSLRTRSNAAADAAASRNRAAHMVGVSKVARVQADSPPAVMISAAWKSGVSHSNPSPVQARAMLTHLHRLPSG